MGDGAGGFLVGVDLGERQARVVVDADMDIFPAIALAAPTRIGLAGAIAGDAMAWALEAAEFLDVDMNKLPGVRTRAMAEFG